MIGVVLAGGRSRRLGRDKANARVAGRPLVAWVVEALREAGAAEVIVIGQPSQRFDALPEGVIRLDDERDGGAEGPLVALARGLRHAAQIDRDGIAFVAPCDVPALHPADIRTAVARLDTNDADAIVLGQTEKGPHPLLAAYRIQPALDATEAARMRGERAARAILESLKIHVIERVALRRPVAMNPCNTPQELEAMETLIAGTNDATVRDMSSSLVAIILAAGKGTRMRSDLPKVLHALGGRPLLHHVLDAAAGAGVGRSILVVGHGAAQVEESVTRAGYGETAFARQPEQRGTGHAVQCALPSVHAAEEVALILSGDVPGMSGAQLRELVDALDDRTSLAMMTFEAEDPTGYGRVLRDEVGEVTCIREQKDASESELQIRECNAGIYAVRVRLLREALPTFSDRNAAGEVYLTDLIDFAARSGRVGTLSVRAEDVVGVNTPEQLAALERRFHDRSGA